jgi:mannose/fructose-specific phosphotransferase system component IIA
MSDVRGVVVAHADLASALVRAVEGISGVKGALAAVSNEQCSPDDLAHRVSAAVDSGPAVVFVDMASGSCGFAGRRIAMVEPDVAIVSGVNLPMLLDFVFHRDMEYRSLAARVVEKGRKGATAHLPPA